MIKPMTVLFRQREYFAIVLFAEGVKSFSMYSSEANQLKKACLTNVFYKMGRPRPLFRLFSVFSNKHYNFYNNNM